MQVLDSYTGEPYVEDYVSPIPDIKRGRESFWRRAELARAAQQYWVSPVMPSEEERCAVCGDFCEKMGTTMPCRALTQGGPTATLSPSHESTTDPRSQREAAPVGWLLRRKDSPSDLFPIFPSQDMAVAAMDWCVRNDGSVGVVLHWLLKGNSVPYLAMMQDIIAEVTRGN